MLAAMQSQSVAFSLVEAFARDGWTLIGSPGIFGVPTAGALCLPAETLVTAERMAPGYPATVHAVQRALALLTFVEIVAGSTTVAALWCRAFPVGHKRLIWRRLRAFGIEHVRAHDRDQLVPSVRNRTRHLAVHDRVICMNLPRHPAR